jgi:PPOX class probable FMN-dependent enzyme
MTLPEDISLIESEDDLRALYPTPMSRALGKILPALDVHCRSIIERSPFVVVATQGNEGADVSPRGDPPGFVQILDDNHLLVPDRVGNNRLDTMGNLLTNPHIGLLFIIPGMGETCRINGQARLTNDARLLSRCAVDRRVPKSGILVKIEEAFVHCSKAFKRSELWNPDKQIDRSELPSYSLMLLEQVRGLSKEQNAAQDAVMDERGLY